MKGNRFYTAIGGVASTCFQAILVPVSPKLSKLTVRDSIRENIASGLTTGD
jgi:hypothetical protein